jgi:hypothetical protein
MVSDYKRSHVGSNEGPTEHRLSHVTSNEGPPQPYQDQSSNRHHTGGSFGNLELEKLAGKDRIVKIDKML